MKTIKTLLSATLLVFTFSAFALNDPETANKLSMEYALKAYIDAVSIGKIKGIQEIIDNEAKFTVTRGEKIINYTKSDILTELKSSENVQQNCSIDQIIIDQNSSQAMVKVTMKYDGFSKVNFVTFNNTNKGWKITNVSSSYK